MEEAEAKQQGAFKPINKSRNIFQRWMSRLVYIFQHSYENAFHATIFVGHSFFTLNKLSLNFFLTK